MGGSKGGKHSKGKGKSKSTANETSHNKTEALNSKHDLAETSKGKALSMGKHGNPQTPGGILNYTEKELEKFLLVKIEELYTKAKGWLLASGYGMADVERAILNYGDVDGPKDDAMDNLLTNTVAFLEKKVEAKGEAFKSMKKLYKAMLETLINSVWDRQPHLLLKDVLWILLFKNWGDVPSTIMPSCLLSGDENKDRITDESHASTSHNSNEGTSTSVPDFSSTIEKTGSESNIESAPKKIVILDSNVADSYKPTFLDEECAESWQELIPNDPKRAFIADLMKSIRNLEEKLKVQKEWAQQTVIDSAKRLSKDFLELKTLRMGKEETQLMKDKKIFVEKLCMLMLKKTEEKLRNENRKVSTMSDSIRTLEVSNACIRADTEAHRLNASEYKNDLNQVMHREKRCVEKLATIEKQTCNLRAKCDEEKQKVLQLQLDVFQAEKEAEEAEERWNHEKKKKVEMLALLSEQTRMAGTRRAIMRSELASVRQQIETDRKLKPYEVRRLEEEVGRLQMFLQLSNVSLEGDRFLYNGVEVTSLEHSASSEHSRHWHCMMCSTNEVSVVFLPCTHQVLCAGCYSVSSSSSVGGRCPYCNAEIHESIKAFGPT